MSQKHRKNEENKPDNSPRVAQRDKISQPFNIRPFEWTEKQKKFIEIARRKETNIIICKSPPGVGKTVLSTFCCLELLNQKRIQEILYLRSPIESSKSIGYLAGDKDTKLQPYGGPIFDHLSELLTQSTIKNLVEEKRIIIESVGFSKGRTYGLTGIIIDEAEDLSAQDLRLAMCRIGRFSKMFIIGDEKQSNIKNSGFLDVFNAFNNNEAKEHGLETFEFTRDDCMRNEVIKYILCEFDRIIT